MGLYNLLSLAIKALRLAALWILYQSMFSPRESVFQLENCELGIRRRIEDVPKSAVICSALS